MCRVNKVGSNSRESSHEGLNSERQAVDDGTDYEACE
jgi:hypothetical protein